MKRLPLLLSLFGGILVLASGCVGTNYYYSPKEEMVIVQSHNHFLELGPCGVPWNYDDQINILLSPGGDHFESSQLVVYQTGKLKVDSGHVVLNRANQTVTIELIFEGYPSGIERGPLKCKYNGVHQYVERDPQPGEVTRQWLQDFYRTNGIRMYAP